MLVAAKEKLAKSSPARRGYQRKPTPRKLPSFQSKILPRCQNPHDRGRICRLHRAAETLTPEQIAYTYASEADLLNVALFGQTAKQWKNNNPGKKGNVRDDANLNQLLVLANMESYNAILIEQGKPQSERLILLRNLAIRQMDTLASINLSAVSALPGGDI